jgi:polysaccharide export outer membrane protein
MWRTRPTLAVSICALVLLGAFPAPVGVLRGQTDAPSAKAVPGNDALTQLVPEPAAAPTSSSAPSQATSLAPNPASEAEPASSTYRLQPYDLIDVDVYNEPDLHKPARLGADGTALLPLIGIVKLGGLTVVEATALVTKKYAAGFVKDPNVMIAVTQFRKSTFSIMGQVARPGIYEIPEGTRVSILEAISLAGGFAVTAAPNAVTVKRTTHGAISLYKIKAADMAQNPDVVPFEILPGDTVVVSAPERSNFSILGQVQRPGLYDIPAGARVSIIEAISLAGGYTPAAAQNGITVKRMARGQLVILPVKAADMAQDPNVVPFEVLPGDTIIVPVRNSTFSILGQVMRPGIYEIPEGSHVNIIEAILMAGGYTRTAAQNSVTVKRLVGGGLKTLKVRAGDMANDKLVPFEVLPGDIVKVNESWY